MNTEITKIVAYCLSIALSDDPWVDIGYRKRPKYGSKIQRFRTAWKVTIEKTIFREFIIILSAAHVAAGVIDKSVIEELAQTYAGGKNHENMYVYLGYTTRHEAIDHLCRSITQYVNSETEEWPSLLFDHLGIQGIPDEKLKAKLFVGCVTFNRTVKHMIALMKRKNTDT
jgi:hypothetical protein